MTHTAAHDHSTRLEAMSFVGIAKTLKPAPNKKMYRMTRDEMQECERHTKMLLEKCFILSNSSSWQ